MKEIVVVSCYCYWLLNGKLHRRSVQFFFSSLFYKKNFFFPLYIFLFTVLWLLSTNPLWIFNKFESSVFEIKCLTLFSKKVSRNSLYIHFNSQILLTHISKVVNNNVVMMVKRNISKEKMWLIEFIKSVMFAIVFAIASGHYLRCDLVVCFCSIFNSWQPCSHIDGFQHQNVHFDCFYLVKRSQF